MGDGRRMLVESHADSTASLAFCSVIMGRLDCAALLLSVDTTDLSISKLINKLITESGDGVRF